MATAWCEVTKNSIKGADMKAGDFWLLVWRRFMALRGLSSDPGCELVPGYRWATSVESRFGTIQREANEFSGCYKQATDWVKGKSGESADSILPKALELFQTKSG